MERIDLLNTIKGSRFEGVLPAGSGTSRRIDWCCSRKPEEVNAREKWWHKDFAPVCGDTLEDFNTLMGHEIALQIRMAREEDRELVLIFSVGPMGMYRWAVEFLKSLERGLPAPSRLQHGRVVRRGGQHASRQQPGRLHERNGEHVLRPAGQSHRRRRTRGISPPARASHLRAEASESCAPRARSSS